MLPDNVVILEFFVRIRGASSAREELDIVHGG